MNQILRARHFDYTAAGIPRLRELASTFCAENPPEFPGVRHIGYGELTTLPLAATAWQCCDAFCPDGVVDCYVLPDCWPHGPGPGISRYVVVHLSPVNACLPLRGGVSLTLVYDDVLGLWVSRGYVTPGGTVLDFAFQCSGVGTFTFYAGPSGTDFDPATTPLFNGIAECDDPLIVLFNVAAGTSVAQLVCDCTNTDTGAAFDVTVTANCRKTVFARHVNYTAAGIPVVAKARPCDWDNESPITCADLTCGIHFQITADPDLGGDCACLDTSGLLNYAAGEWNYAGGFACPGSPGQFGVTCTMLGDGRIQFDVVNFVCGVTAGGVEVASVVIDPDDLETLDVTILVDVTGTASSCTGNCTWTWNAMAGTWTATSDTCSPDCDTCNPAPTSPPGSPVDGQTWSEPCTGSATAECCTGRIRVRLTR